MLLMFHYDVWKEAGKDLGFSNVKESISTLLVNKMMLQEMQEFIEHQIEKIEFVEKDLDCRFSFSFKTSQSIQQGGNTHFHRDEHF